MDQVNSLQGVRIHITGVVQGVGFRPFVYGLAMRLGLTGWVRNTSAGVDIELDGSSEAIEAFREALQEETPPLAHIDEIDLETIPPNGYGDFRIIHSQPLQGAFQPISPDVSICEEWERELFDPQGRRYRYPFINCTHCGPRFTIIEDIPYDRPHTTMAGFKMCPQCEAEYNDPLDRRFHAQPTACSVCGPDIWLEVEQQRTSNSEQALLETRRLLRDGKIVAVKGLGGFHLACDATNTETVTELRRRKLRVDKAFAIMMPDLETVEAHCYFDDAARELLSSRERPIVILTRKSGSNIAKEVAPRQHTLGVMLPYTPLHAMLMEQRNGFPQALVMTSGNLSEEPIAIGNQEARVRLGDVADAFLMHDRGIHTRCDDSVVRVFDKDVYPYRRSRGYAPYPVHLKHRGIPLLAVGGELKNAFCLTRGQYAFLSHHIGDLENYETLRSFEEGVNHLERLFRIQPEALAYDLHPNYFATRYALERASQEDIPAIGVQHHHAHIVSCMAENGLENDTTVIGVAFDGTGYGDDAAIWGGEVFLANVFGYERLFHLAYCPLPGGDMAIRQPWRSALAWLQRVGLEQLDLPSLQTAFSPKVRNIVLQQIELGFNTPLTSSMGRLFDAAAALAGVRHTVNYEAQAAIEFEALVDPDEMGVYSLDVGDGVIDPTSMIRSLVADVLENVPAGKIAARFHRGIAQMVVDVCNRARECSGVTKVVLSGGVWQNMVLLSNVLPALHKADFSVLLHRKVPTNDGGIALGQAVVALNQLRVR